MFLEFSTAYYSATAYKALTESVGCLVFTGPPPCKMDGVNSSPTVVPLFLLDYRLLIKNETGKWKACSSLTAVCRAFLNVLNEDASQHTLFCRVTGHFITV